jgi:hypothetical protein
MISCKNLNIYPGLLPWGAPRWKKSLRTIRQKRYKRNNFEPMIGCKQPNIVSGATIICSADHTPDENANIRQARTWQLQQSLDFDHAHTPRPGLALSVHLILLDCSSTRSPPSIGVARRYDVHHRPPLRIEPALCVSP